MRQHTFMDFTVKTDQGKYDLTAGVKVIGSDVLVAIYGGEKPHIGAVAMAQPRPGLRDPGITKSTASVFCFLSHKEDGLVKAASESISSRFNTNVVVTAGIHWDDLSEEGIKKVMANAELLVEMINSELEVCLKK